jgi:uncharacterized protein YigA (DUF484 family)
MLTTNDVLSWLADHPDLLIDHPELLDQLNLPHDAGTTSLIERQVDRLRTSHRALEQRLATLTSIASENEQLIRRLHALSLSLMAEEAIDQCLRTLIDRLKTEFQADAVRLHLGLSIADAEDLDAVVLHREWSEPLLQLKERAEIRCGRLTRDKVEALFGAPDADSVKSLAVVPLATVGLLAIGSKSAERFHPGMGTLFLELLAETLITRLSESIALQRKRA